jgi:hypothetical protein
MERNNRICKNKYVEDASTSSRRLRPSADDPTVKVGLDVLYLSCIIVRCMYTARGGPMLKQNRAMARPAQPKTMKDEC